MSEDQGGPDGLNPEGLPGPAAIEPPHGEQHNNSDDSTPPPGSLPLFKEQGNPKFPKALLVGGGFEILANPICSGMSEWLVSESVLDLNTSIEAVLLHLLRNALANGDKSWPEFLRSFDWFPNALFDFGPAKRDARWDWIMSKGPADPSNFVATPHHSFWLKGYGTDKVKDDKMIEANCYKTLNYFGFRGIIRSVASEVKLNDPGPVEVGNLSRRHWNNLKEPSISDLKKRVVKKKKRIRSKSTVANTVKKAQKNLPVTADPQGGPQGQVRAPAQAAGLNLPAEPEVMVVGEVSGPNDQPCVGPGAAAGGPPPPQMSFKPPRYNFLQTLPL